MRNVLEELLRRLFRWAFKKEVFELNVQIAEAKRLIEKNKLRADKLEELLGNIDVSADINIYAPSWAVISIQGKSVDYIKFVELSQQDAREIQSFLRRFDRDRVKVDCSPQIRGLFEI